MLTDRKELAEQRFRTLVLSWLRSLPPAGWEGTSHQLGEELAGFAGRKGLVVYVPACPARKVAALAGALAAGGFGLTHHRTKSERTIRFAPRGRG